MHFLSRFQEYCGPPAFTGVCCLFVTNQCNDVTVGERVAYYTNTSYPYVGSEPQACMLKIRPQRDTCWVRRFYKKGSKITVLSLVNAAQMTNFNIVA